MKRDIIEITFDMIGTAISLICSAALVVSFFAIVGALAFMAFSSL